MLDGETPGVDPVQLDAHLDGCRDCRLWRERAHIVTRRARVALAQPAPAASPSLLAAIAAGARAGPRRETTLTRTRLALLAVAVAQFALTVPALILGSDHDAPIHVAHEMGSFDMALAVGFLVAAWQPSRARGMHVVVGAAALLLLLTATIDLLSGRTSPADETPHLLAVAGWMLMYRIAALSSPLEPAGEATRPARLRRWREARLDDVGGLDAELGTDRLAGAASREPAAERTAATA